MPSLRCLMWYLILANMLFLALAVTMLVFDAMEYQNPSESDVFNKAVKAGSLRFKGILSFVISGLKMLMAVCGIAGAAMWSKLLLMISVIFLIVDMVFRGVFIVLLAIAGQHVHMAAGLEFRSVFHIYGNSTAAEAVPFTKKVDDFMTENPCCGWSNNFDENLYINSSWHLGVDRKQQLPSKCCTSKAIDNKRLDDCLMANDTAMARKDGYVHSKNCLSIIMSSTYSYMYISITINCVVIILDIFAVYASRELSLAEDYGESSSVYEVNVY